MNDIDLSIGQSDDEFDPDQLWLRPLKRDANNRVIAMDLRFADAGPFTGKAIGDITGNDLIKMEWYTHNLQRELKRYGLG